MGPDSGDKPDTSSAAPAKSGAGAIFLQFLAFGARAFGGPVAQIGELSTEFVGRRGWVSAERFRRALAVYQLLPGPEAHEMCCYLGAARAGWRGALAAGLGFMLPGLLLMLVACALYERLDLAEPRVAGAMCAMQLAASALIIRAAWRLGSPLVRAGRAMAVVTLLSAAVAAWWFTAPAAAPVSEQSVRTGAGAPELLAHGLTAGLVTFGGAYTAIPYVTTVASGPDGWMPRSEILDGVAIASVLPAPLVIFGTFVGWRGAGLLGALAFTLGIFLPAFSFTLFGFGTIERLLSWPPARHALDLAGAVAVGLMAGAAIHIVLQPLQSPVLGRFAWPALAVLLVLVFRSRTRLAVPAIVLGAAAAGALIG